MGWREAFKPTPDKKFKEFPPARGNEITQITEISGCRDIPKKPTGSNNIAYLFEERAAIYEFEAGHTREEAERLAYRDTAIEYIEKMQPETVFFLKNAIA